MDADIALKFVLPALGVLGTLAVTLLGIIVRRLYGSIDLLFRKQELMGRQINVLKLAALQGDPESTALFNALTAAAGEHK